MLNRLRPYLPVVLAIAIALISGAGIAIVVTDDNAQTPDRTITVVKPRGAILREGTRAAQSSAPACDPRLGTGHMGACAPRQSFRFLQHLTGSSNVSHLGPIGVDLSSYQPCGPNFRALGIRFAIFKFTEGTGYSDRCAHASVGRAKAQHVPYAGYDFLRPGRSSAKAEADHFAAVTRAVGAARSPIGPVADVEATVLGPSATNAYVCAWHREVRRQLHRSDTITYTGNWFWGPRVGGSSCGTKLWVSAYTSSFVVPSSWRHQGATIWQYGDGQYGPGPRIRGWDTDVWLRSAPTSPAKPASVLTGGERRIVARRCLHFRARFHHRRGSALERKHYRWSLHYKRAAAARKRKLDHLGHFARHHRGVRRRTMARTAAFTRAYRRQLCR